MRESACVRVRVLEIPARVIAHERPWARACVHTRRNCGACYATCRNLSYVLQQAVVACCVAMDEMDEMAARFSAAPATSARDWDQS